MIGDMLQHNIASIRYPDYHVFAGCYPNDDLTQEAVRSVAVRFPNVHMALCPHDGPTSKGDCLNWVYQHILLFEEEHSARFDLILTHDAEDLIHPDELRWINFYSGRYDFIQTPVLALATPLRKMTHGIYCDEFAENHTIDMAVRARTGGFVPGAGVGTGYRREALDRLAEAASNRIFEPESLTEDYENGLRLFRLGCTQVFVPISSSGEGRPGLGGDAGILSADLELRAAAADALGDGNHAARLEPLRMEGEAGRVVLAVARPQGIARKFLEPAGQRGFSLRPGDRTVEAHLAGSCCLDYGDARASVVRTLVRMACTARVYGWWFALGVPLRAVYANLLNSAASVRAVARYIARSLKREPLSVDENRARLSVARRAVEP